MADQSPITLPAARPQIAAILIGAAMGLSLFNRFIQDDAYISLRYARNLVDGHGLVWNPGGEHVEGYTNFLWTVILALPLKFGIDPYLFITVLGMVLLGATLRLTYLLAVEATKSTWIGVAAVALCGFSYTFSAYATGGLETMLQTLLCVACMHLSVKVVREQHLTPGLLIGQSVCAALAILTRLDSGVLVALPGLFTTWAILRSDAPAARKLGSLGALALPVLGIVGAWLAWKVSYYGDLLPNTFYVKATGVPLIRGVYYVGIFLCVYLFAPLLLVAVLLSGRAVRVMGASVFALLVLTLGAWCMYVAKVGGDFMEFRFMVAATPIIAVLSAWAIERLLPGTRAPNGAVAILVAASAVHGFMFDKMPWKRGLESISDLRRNLDNPEYDWRGIGSFLASEFKGDPSVSIAVTPAGAIPYYSGLPSVDMLGLNDRWIARNGVKLSDRPGHQKITTVARLVEVKTTFIIGHPTIVQSHAEFEAGVSVEQLRKMFVGKPVPDPQSFPAGTRVVFIPFAQGRELMAIYLTPTPEMDRRIERLGWKTVPLLASGANP